jgi:heptosyltransferase-2
VRRESWAPTALAALIRKTHLYVSNDTGAMHVCTAVGTPGIFLFGPGQPSRYAPYRDDGRYTVLYKPSACAPCDNSTCPDRRCLDAITVDEVFNALVALKGKHHA